MNTQQPNFETVESVKQYAETLIAPDKRGLRNYADHVYVIRTAEGHFSLFFHPEDKYLASYIPVGAKLLWHGRYTYDGDNAVVVWDERDSPVTDNERKLLGDDLADFFANLLKD